MATQQQIEMVLWSIRSLRLENAEITAEAVQKIASRHGVGYTLELVQEAMNELEKRGFKIREYQDDVPTNCIAVEQGGTYHG